MKLLGSTTNLVSCQFLFLQIQTFTTYTTSTSRLTKPYINNDIFITKPDKGNGVVILDRKLYDDAIQEIISDTSKSKSSMKTQIDT